MHHDRVRNVTVLDKVSPHLEQVVLREGTVEGTGSIAASGLTTRDRAVIEVQLALTKDLVNNLLLLVLSQSAASRTEVHGPDVHDRVLDGLFGHRDLDTVLTDVSGNLTSELELALWILTTLRDT